MRSPVLCQMLSGSFLSLVLTAVSFASIPFVALAQTESPSGNKNVEQTDPAEKEIVLTLEGIMRGGVFIFRENTIKPFSIHDGFQMKVDGVPWDGFEKELFKLDYTPDFAKAVILEKECGPDVTINIVSRRADYFILQMQNGSKTKPPTPFRIKVAVKNQVPHDDIETVSSVGPKGKRIEPEKAVVSPSAGIPPKTVAANPDSKEICLSLEGKIHDGYFVFEGNTIRLTNMLLDPKMNHNSKAEGITVNGKPWDDLSKPFELDYTPDFVKAGVLEQEGKVSATVFPLNKEGTGFVLRVMDPGKSAPAPFRVKLAMKDQLPHDDLPRYRRTPDPRIAGDFEPGMHKSQPYISPGDRLWEECNREHKIVLECNVNGQGSFIFEGNTIRYRHALFDYPDLVTVNGRWWMPGLQDTFELDFPIDTAHPEVVQTLGRKELKVTRINSQRFEILFNDSVFGQTGVARYGVTITSQKATVDQTPEQDKTTAADSASPARDGTRVLSLK